MLSTDVFSEMLSSAAQWPDYQFDFGNFGADAGDFWFPSAADMQQQQAYSSASTHLLEALGAKSRLGIWENHLREIAHILTSLARILNDTIAVRPHLA